MQLIAIWVNVVAYFCGTDAAFMEVLMPPATEYAYRQFRYAPSMAGYPSLAVVSQTQVLVADWRGHLSLVNLDSNAIVKTVDLRKPLLQNTLTSPLVLGTTPLRCAVATRAMYSVVWEPESGRVTEIESETI